MASAVCPSRDSATPRGPRLGSTGQQARRSPSRESRESRASPIPPREPGLPSPGSPASSELLAGLRALVLEQRTTNAILREVAYGLGAKEPPPARPATQERQSAPNAVVGGGARPAGYHHQAVEETTAVKAVDVELKDKRCKVGLSEPKLLGATESPDKSNGSAPASPAFLRQVSWCDALYIPNVKTWLGRRGFFHWSEDRGMRQLLQYDFDSLQAWAAIPFIVCECSIFRLRRSHGIQMLVQVLIMIVICFSLQREAFSEILMDRIRADAEGVINMTDALSKMVPFFLGLFISVCLGRWWTLRSQYLQPIISASVELSFWLRVTLPPSANWVLERIQKNCLLGNKLLYVCARDRQKGINLESLVEEGLLAKQDFERFNRKTESLPDEVTMTRGLFDFDVAGLPFTWSAHLIYRVFQFGSRPDNKSGINMPIPVVVKMLDKCMEAKHCIEDVETMLMTPLPFPYVHLVCLLVHFNAVITCVKVGLVCGTDPTLTLSRFFCEMFTVLAVNSLYTGLLCLSVVITDPFGDDLVDCPAALMHHRLWKAQHFAGLFEDDDGELDEELKTRLAASSSQHGRLLHAANLDVANQHGAHSSFSGGELGGDVGAAHMRSQVQPAAPYHHDLHHHYHTARSADDDDEPVTAGGYEDAGGEGGD